MKKLALILMLGLFLASDSGADQTNVIYGYVGNYGLTAVSNVTVTLTLQYPNPRSVGMTTVRQDAITTTTTGTGYFGFTNLQWGKYAASIAGRSPTVVGFWVQPETTGTMAMASLPSTLVVLPPNPATNYYTQAQVDALLGSTSGVSVGATNDSGVIVSTNGTSRLLSLDVSKPMDYAATSGAATNVGTAAYSNATDFAAASHSQALSTITDAGTAAYSNANAFMATGSGLTNSDTRNITLAGGNESGSALLITPQTDDYPALAITSTGFLHPNASTNWLTGDLAITGAFYGDGSHLTGISATTNAAELTTGTLPNARLGTNTAAAGKVLTATSATTSEWATPTAAGALTNNETRAVTFESSVTASNFVGNGQSLSNTTSIIDVKRDFGAKGDAVTDDTANIQAAFDSLSDKGVVVIPSGVYVISNLVWNPPDYSELRMDGAYFFGSKAGTGPLLTVGDATQIRSQYKIKGLKLFNPAHPYVDWTTNLCGLDIRNLANSEVGIDLVSGYRTNVLLRSSTGFYSVNNRFYFGNLGSSERSLVIQEEGTGWLNSCVFYGGYFTAGAGADGFAVSNRVHISARGGHNNFYSPILESSTNSLLSAEFGDNFSHSTIYSPYLENCRPLTFLAGSHNNTIVGGVLSTGDVIDSGTSNSVFAPEQFRSTISSNTFTGTVAANFLYSTTGATMLRSLQIGDYNNSAYSYGTLILTSGDNTNYHFDFTAFGGDAIINSVGAQSPITLKANNVEAMRLKQTGIRVSLDQTNQATLTVGGTLTATNPVFYGTSSNDTISVDTLLVDGGIYGDIAGATNASGSTPAFLSANNTLSGSNTFGGALYSAGATYYRTTSTNNAFTFGVNDTVLLVDCTNAIITLPDCTNTPAGRLVSIVGDMNYYGSAVVSNANGFQQVWYTNLSTTLYSNQSITLINTGSKWR